MKYRVALIIDNQYGVYESVDFERSLNGECERPIPEFSGSLSDCNAWLQLYDKGYFC